MFGKIGRSWEFAKFSYGMIWNHKTLLVFPILSTIAGALVLASYIGGLFGFGLVEWVEQAGGRELVLTNDVAVYVATFIFYFVSYFVIVFFNSALTGCALEAMNGETPSVGHGIGVAMKRLPQILAWAFVSALIGIILRAIENAHEKAGEILAAVLGTAWTALTYFVVPILVVEGAGPVEAIKRSGSTLKKTWGEALVGNFSLGLLAFLVMLPAIGIIVGLVFVMGGTQSMTAMVTAGVAIVCVIVLASAFTSAADMVFKVALYGYATGNTVPQGLDSATLQAAFAPKKK